MNKNRPILIKPIDLKKFKNENNISVVSDFYKDLLEDLFLVRNPRYKFDKNYKEAFERFLEEHCAGKTLEESGVWVYFPWNKILAHYLSDELHQEIRTARNKNIITEDEQNKFYNYKIGIAGLSVGSHPALTIALMGGCKKMKLADPDTISASNLNRIRYDFTFVGKNKCEVAARMIYQINPYADIEIYNGGITDDNIDDFMEGLDVFVEEVDDLYMKMKSRIKARELGIPVIMATDNGDNAIIDVERYDLNENLELFNGAVGHITIEEFQKMSPQDLPKLATKIAGPNIVVPRMLTSLLEVGKTLYSWPQLADAATLSGVAVAYLIKRMSLGQEVVSGRSEINLDLIFDPDYNTPIIKEERDSVRRKFMKIIGLA